MGLEVSPQYIQDLDAAWPLGTESQRQGDDHIRNVKTVLKTQFPSLGSEAVTATASELNALVADNSWESAWPVGAIYFTMGTHNPSDFLPGTWGQIGQGRMLIGVGSLDGYSYSVGATGGEAKHALSQAEMPIHDHPPEPGYSGYQMYKPGGGVGSHSAGNDTVSVGTTGNAGSGQQHENRPSYLACVIWQRLS